MGVGVPPASGICVANKKRGKINQEIAGASKLLGLMV
jgi:hypothetical protein